MRIFLVTTVIMFAFSCATSSKEDDSLNEMLESSSEEDPLLSDPDSMEAMIDQDLEEISLDELSQASEMELDPSDDETFMPEEYESDEILEGDINEFSLGGVDESPDYVGAPVPDMPSETATSEEEAFMSELNSSTTFESDEPVDMDAMDAPSENFDSMDSMEASSTSMAQGSSYYVVKPGDTLAKIAKILYGSAARWKDLAQENNIQNSNRIYPGDKLNFDQGTPYNEVYDTHFVKKGETLQKIAKKIYGKYSYWRYLWKLNDQEVSNPNRLSVGQQLRYVTPNNMGH